MEKVNQLKAELFDIRMQQENVQYQYQTAMTQLKEKYDAKMEELVALMKEEQGKDETK